MRSGSPPATACAWRCGRPRTTPPRSATCVIHLVTALAPWANRGAYLNVVERPSDTSAAYTPRGVVPAAAAACHLRPERHPADRARGAVNGPVSTTSSAVHAPLPHDLLARHLAAQDRVRETARCRAAAARAGRAYPGLLGEFVRRELLAYAEFGPLFADGLVPRLIDALLDPDPPPGT